MWSDYYVIKVSEKYGVWSSVYIGRVKRVDRDFIFIFYFFKKEEKKSDVRIAFLILSGLIFQQHQIIL